MTLKVPITVGYKYKSEFLFVLLINLIFLINI